MPASWWKPGGTGLLAGRTVLIPRAPGQAGELAARVRALGGEPLEAPTIVIRPGDTAALDAALRELHGGGFVAVCFTSPNGVAAVARALERTGLDPGVFSQVTVAAVGPATARSLDRSGIAVDLTPAISTTDALGRALPTGSGRVLLPRADLAAPGLAEALQAKGYEPVNVTAYITDRPADLPAEVAERLTGGGVDLLAFTSASTARNLVALVGDRSWSGRVVSIGPVTTATLRTLGIEVAVEADRHDLDGLVSALIEAARVS